MIKIELNREHAQEIYDAGKGSDLLGIFTPAQQALFDAMGKALAEEDTSDE